MQKKFALGILLLKISQKRLFCVFKITAILLLAFTINVTAINAVSTTKSTEAVAQKFRVSGKVVSSEDNQPLPGVNVVVENTTIGTTTDMNGKYSLDVDNPNVSLVFTYVGYVNEVVPINGRSVVDITLVVDVAKLEEVVVIGYGAVKKSDLTGAISTVTSKNLGDRSSTDIGGLIQGKVAGVEVTSGQVRVRGVTTLNNTNPLYVIDGFVGGDMGTVHPSDIASIEVLKDASSTAIYGARGANGVILVTTKKGKTGAPRVDLNAFWGISNPSKKIDMLNASDYMDLLKDIELNGGTKPEDLYAKSKLFNSNGSYNPDALVDRTNWQDQIFQQGSTQEYTLSVRGGGERGIYSVSGSYNDSKSIAGSREWKNYKFGVTGEWRLFNDKLKIGENMRFQYWNTTGIDPDVLGALRMPPYSPILDPSALGGYAYVTTTNDLNDAVNPVTDLMLTDNAEKGTSIMGNVYAQLEIIRGLTFNSSVGITGNTQNNFKYTKPRQNGNLVFPDAESSEHYEFGFSPKIENYLTYSRTLGVHDFSVMVGNTYENYQQGRSVDITGKGYINDEVRIATVAREKNISGNNAWHNSYLSYFGRVNYSLLNKYLVTFNMRTDASPKFAPSNRWANFPSVALGWKIHEESFLKGVSWLNQLKLRASYGITGNDAIGSYRYFSSVHSKSTYAFPSQGFGGINFNGSTINTLASPIIKWESTKNTSLGVDVSILKNQLEFNADYFVKNSYDILFGVPQPPSLGMGNNGGGGDAIVNAASCENRGFEIMLTYNGNAGDLNYQISGNATFVKNEVTSLGSGRPYNAGTFGFYSTNRTEEGQPIGYFYGFKTDKVYVNQAEVDADNQAARDAALGKNPNLTVADLAKVYFQESSTSAGDIRFKDLNNDGKITDDDRAYLGTSIPKASFGLNANASYKGFDFFMAWSGVTGNSVLYNFGYWMEGMIRPFNSTTEVLNRWRSESDPGDGRTPRAVKTDPSKNLRMSDRFIYDGTYLRLKLISLGYTLPKALVSRISFGTVNNLRVYVSSDNLLTFTKYPGFNPEIGGDQYQPNLLRGSDGGSWPAARTIRFGASLAF